MIEYIYDQDILKIDVDAYVNTVNCVGIMGKGIALHYKKNFPEMYNDYIDKCKKKKIKVGSLDVFHLSKSKSIIYFPTKKHWRGKSKIEYIEWGLKDFVKLYKQWGIKSVAFPPLGCGNGGLDWNVVSQLMEKYLESLDLDIKIVVNLKPLYLNELQRKSEILTKEQLKTVLDTIDNMMTDDQKKNLSQPKQSKLKI